MEKQNTVRNQVGRLQDHLLHVSSQASVNSDSDDSGFVPSEEDKPGSAGSVVSLYPENHRRFSTTCAPSSHHYKEISIPEVVVTSHDDEESPSTASKPSISEKRGRLRRSLSSPDGMLIPLLSPAEEQTHFRNDDFIVTLEDVEKFKSQRRRSGSAGSNVDER